KEENTEKGNREIVVVEKGSVLEEGETPTTTTSATPPEAETHTRKAMVAATTGSGQQADPTPEEPPSNEAQAVLEALAPYGVTDQQAAQDLVEACRQQAPDCTPAEIAFAIRQKAPLARSNPIGFLLTAVPKCFAGAGLEQLRSAMPSSRLS